MPPISLTLHTHFHIRYLALVFTSTVQWNIEPLLQVTTTVLVLAQARDPADEILDVRAREAAAYDSK